MDLGSHGVERLGLGDDQERQREPLVAGLRVGGWGRTRKNPARINRSGASKKRKDADQSQHSSSPQHSVFSEEQELQDEQSFLANMQVEQLLRASIATAERRVKTAFMRVGVLFLRELSGAGSFGHVNKCS
jgi:hypothetical protein